MQKNIAGKHASEGEKRVFLVAIRSGDGDTNEIFSFTTSEERDAFLASIEDEGVEWAVAEILL